jgi:hypothetical protein
VSAQSAQVIDMFGFSDYVSSLPDPQAEFGCPMEDRTLPTLPPAYQAIVTANFGDLAYTVSYMESYDAPNNVLHYEGHERTSGTIDVISASSFYRYNASACVQYAASLTSLPFWYQPLAVLLASPIGEDARAGVDRRALQQRCAQGRAARTTWVQCACADSC